MRSLLAFILITFFTFPVFGQEGVRPDTLDWHDYYPLDVGNIWEWKIDDYFHGVTLVKQHIESDTLVNNQYWVLQITHTEGTYFGQFGVSVDTLLLRYDEPYGRVLARIPESGREYDYTCDLSGDFEQEVLCGAGLTDSTSTVFWGYYAEELEGYPLVVGTDTVYYAAYKQDPVIVGSVPPVYFHGIGRLEQPGDGFSGTIAFTYLRIKGKEYGHPASLVNNERPTRKLENQFELFPNPVSRVLTVRFDTSLSYEAFQIYDLQGRQVINRLKCQSPCQLEVEALSPGIYFLRVDFEDGLREIRRFIVTR